MKKVVVISALALLASCSGSGQSYSHLDSTAYSGWCKFYNRTDITIDEWSSMRRCRMLPGQVYRHSSSSSDAMLGVATGVAVGSAMAAGRR